MKRGLKENEEYQRKLSQQVAKEESVIENSQSAKKITQHEDIALKVIAQYFGEGLLEFFGIEGRIVRHIVTEPVYVEIRRMLEDFNFEMEDGSIIHFEFQSKDGGIKDLRRFRSYDAVSGEKEERSVTTYVLYSGNIKNPITELKEGINTYRVIPLIMQNYEVEKYFDEIEKKIENKLVITKKDLVALALAPLMSGVKSQKERIHEAFQLLKKINNIDKDILKKVEAIIYIMASKFLDDEEQYLMKGEIKMLPLTRMILDDAVEEGMEKGIKGLIKGCKLISLDYNQILNSITEAYALTKEKAEEYMKKFY